ncbi:uncharacterized protein [Pyrus communis]|uniref:uncharacterized protein n=1 Tax=Pyrus communis TaxID=23211 RepID=UPI0035BF3081
MSTARPRNWFSTKPKLENHSDRVPNGVGEPADVDPDEEFLSPVERFDAGVRRGRITPPRREPHRSAEPSFPDVAQLGEAIATVIHSTLRPPQRTPLETMYNLKLDKFEGNEGFEGAERWLEHIEKTFRVLHNQGNLPVEKWVETTSWFLGMDSASWWEQELRCLTPAEKTDWDVFRELFRRRFVPPEYIDRKKQEFTELRQEKLTANEYYRRFTDLSRYHPDVAGNPVEMLRRFRLGTKKKWRSMATTTSCDTYQEFYEILLRIEDSENMPSESEDEEKDGNQRKDDKGKGQASLGPRRTQNFKRGGTSSSSSSGGFSATGQGRGGRFAGGARGHRQGDAGRGRAPARLQWLLYLWANGTSGCKLSPESAEALADFLATALSISHYPYSQGGYPQYSSGYMPYPPIPAGGSQWFQGGHIQQGEIATSSAGSLRQSGQPSQGRGCQGYLAHVVFDDAAPSRVEDVRVVRHFPDVFPEDLPGLPPDRDMEFTIELLPDLRSTGVRLEAEDREVALLANFQVRPILVDRVFEAQVADRETQEMIQARDRDRMRDLRVRDSDGMLM